MLSRTQGRPGGGRSPLFPPHQPWRESKTVLSRRGPAKQASSMYPGCQPPGAGHRYCWTLSGKVSSPLLLWDSATPQNCHRQSGAAWSLDAEASAGGWIHEACLPRRPLSPGPPRVLLGPQGSHRLPKESWEVASLSPRLTGSHPPTAQEAAPAFPEPPSVDKPCSQPACGPSLEVD